MSDNEKDELSKDKDIDLSDDTSGVQKRQSGLSIETLTFGFILGFVVILIGLLIYGISSGAIRDALAPKHPEIIYIARESSESQDSTSNGSSDVDTPSSDSSSDFNGDTSVSDSSGGTSGNDGTSTTSPDSEQASETPEAISDSNTLMRGEIKGSRRLRLTPDLPLDDLLYYVVESTDTLSELAKEFNVPIGQLIELNVIEDPNLIYDGETLLIPRLSSKTDA